MGKEGKRNKRGEVKKKEKEKKKVMRDGRKKVGWASE